MRAVDALDADQFEACLHEIHLGSRWDVGSVAEAIESAQGYVETHHDVSTRIRFLCAAAPYHSLSHGYRPVRHRLVKLLGSARSSEASSRLVPEIRLALSDLALRNGEIRFSLRQLLSAAIWMQAPAPADLERRYHEQAARIYLAGRMRAFSLGSLEKLARVTAGSGEADGFYTDWLEIAARSIGGRVRSVDRLIESIEGKRLDLLTEAEVAAFWVAKTWRALQSGAPTKGRRFLEQARQFLPESGTFLIRADVMFLEAWFLEFDGAEREDIRNKLQEAREATVNAAYPDHFSQMLIRILNLGSRAKPPPSGSVFLEELAAFAAQTENMLAHSEGLAARAVLLGESSSMTSMEVINTFLESRFYRDHFDHVLSDVTVDLQAEQERLVAEPSHAGDTHGHYYYMIFFLILAILVLVLVLRIRTQQHLARNLSDALEKARLAERSAEDASRLKSRFLANVSHEIKTPISGLVGMASLLDEIVEDPELRNYVKTVRICSENLHVLMNDLLSLGRMESGVFEIEEKVFDPRAIAQYSLQMVQKPAQEKGLRVSADVCERLPLELISDGTRIGQVLTNLLTNAIKYTEKGEACLRMDYERTLGYAGILRCVVSDTGKGIPEDKLSRVFEPFHQSGQGADGSHGTGLGLAICQKLVQLMGGTIDVKSELGKGSVFTVQIPVREKK